MAKIAAGIDSHHRDMIDRTSLEGAMTAANPDVVIRMAAQSLVRYSHHPLETFMTHVAGTANIARHLPVDPRHRLRHLGRAMCAKDRGGALPRARCLDCANRARLAVDARPADDTRLDCGVGAHHAAGDDMRKASIADVERLMEIVPGR